ncbi:hypothetical protein FRUB_05087 [Fimbriiglobus ruber]|uniref:Uncharacterized protein n=2 Tax=Fimbriiglobus ruber TaxID=1908690 RepID=A0A225DNL7_9BACT|nr:hypothetical protein FRUB_05087 [Fimbriiglobus ruber]
MLPLYVKEAEGYSISVESDPKKSLELKKEPVLAWSNPVRSTTQGAVFVWLREGRPAALGCIYSHPHQKLPGRVIRHELHALDPEKLLVTRDSPNLWQPEAGLVRVELPGAPGPVATPGGRLVQLRKLAQEFVGHSVDRDMQKWDLRLLPTPLYRYPIAETGVVDGAVFALMSGGGTDPEVLLVIEARAVNGKLRWEYTCGRFSDWDLHVRHKDTEVFTYVAREAERPDKPRLQLYRIYPEKVVTPEGKLLARFRPTPGGMLQLIPFEDK